MSGMDRRSVGELLLDTELVARRVLMDGPDLQAPPMVRTWGEVVEAASDLWRALPPPVPVIFETDPRPLRGDDIVMKRLQEMTTALHRSLRGRPWPGDGPGDDQLLTMADNLGRAAQLVAQASPRTPRRSQARADLAAAKARLMHALYLASHGVTVALNNEVADLQIRATARHTGLSRAPLTLATATRTRVVAFEQLAGGYIARAYPDELAGEHRDPALPTRLAQALAGWDVAAHRCLASDRRPANLARVARTQTLIADHGHLLLDAGVHTGQLTGDQYHARLSPALDRTQARWRHTTELWNTLTRPSERRLDPTMNLAAGEVRAAFLEIDFDRTGPASPTTMADRTDLPGAATAVQQAICASVEIAHVMRELVDDPQLRAAARPVNTMASALAAEATGTSTNARKAAWVSPKEIAANRPIPLPEIVRDACRGDLDSTIEAGRAAMGASATLDPPTGCLVAGPSAPPRQTLRDPTSRAARREPITHVHAPGPRCER